MKPVPAKLSFPSLAAVLLLAAFPLFAQEAQDNGPVLRVVETQDRIIPDPGQDPAHYRHRLACVGNRAGFRGGGIPSTGT